MKKLFLELVEKQSVKVLDQDAIDFALEHNYYDTFEDFLDEAVFECWIPDYPEETA